jgi:DNA polymerase III subunit beta
MTINIMRETLLNPLQTVIRTVEQRSTLPILLNILIKIRKDGSVTLTASDLNMWVVANSTMQLTPPTSDLNLTLPAKKLYEICKLLPDNSEIQLNKKHGHITVSSGNSKFKLSTLPAEDYPDTPDTLETEPLRTVMIDNEVLSHLLNRTLFAASNQDARPTFHGILLDISPGQIKSIATDGHRLALNNAEIEKNSNEEIKEILPRKSAIEIQKLLSGTQGRVKLGFGKDRQYLKVECGERKLITKLIEGSFPDYRRVIPNNCDKEIIVDRHLFKNALQKSQVFCQKNSGARLEFRSGALKIISDNAENERSEDEIQIQYNGPDITIGVNVGYLLENINILETDAIILRLSEKIAPILIEEKDSPFNSAFVIMPMKI